MFSLTTRPPRPKVAPASPYRRATKSPENHTGSQVTWLRGNDADCEAEAAEIALLKVATVIDVEPLRWGRGGNVIAAAGAYLFDQLERA